jgi:hypothetical protein
MMAVGMLVAEMTSQHAHDGHEYFSEPQTNFTAVVGMAPTTARLSKQ